MIQITGQIPELVLYKGEQYALAGINGEGLFEPIEFGITPTSASTACWRGFQMGYKIENGKFLLDWMLVSTNQEELPEINAVSARKSMQEYSLFSHRYEGINLKSRFRGKLLIAKDFIQQMYVHMGFQKAYRYQTVFELVIEEGSIIEVKDRSQDMEKYRNQEESVDPEKVGVKKFVRDSFSLDYDF